MVFTSMPIKMRLSLGRSRFTYPTRVRAPRRRADGVRVSVRLRRATPIEITVGPLPRAVVLLRVSSHLLAVRAVRTDRSSGSVRAHIASRNGRHHSLYRGTVGATPVEVAIHDVVWHCAALEATLKEGINDIFTLALRVDLASPSWLHTYTYVTLSLSVRCVLLTQYIV